MSALDEIKKLTNKKSRKFRKWRDKTLFKNKVTPQQIEAAAAEAVVLISKHEGGEQITVDDAVDAALAILKHVGLSFTLAILALLLLAGCKGKGKTEALDWSKRPAPDQISQPLGRYPLGEPVPIWFDNSGIYPSARQSLPDGLGNLKLKDIVERADGATDDIVAWLKALPPEHQADFAAILKRRFGMKL